MKNQPIKSWLSENLWNIISMVIVVLTGAIYLKVEVSANTRKINELTNVVAKYPSKDFFDLKFETIDNSINELKDEIKSTT